MNSPRYPSLWLVVSLIISALAPLARVHAVTLQQVVSRENAAFNLTTNSMSVGRDGKVYLCNPNGGSSYIMRINTDGTQKGGAVEGTESANAVAANAAGVIATANAHFAHSVNVYAADFSTIATNPNFLVSDAVGWDAPADIEVGASGDFYGLDQHNNRIYRINPLGQITTTYTFPAQPSNVEGFRVSEANQQFIIGAYAAGKIVCVGFDGLQQWSSGVTGVSWGDTQSGGIDFDDSGTLYTINPTETVIRKWTVTGAGPVPIGTVPLTGANPGGNLRLAGGLAVIRYGLNTELFRVFDLTTGAWIRTVVPDIDSLTATYASETWTAGTVMPFTLTFTSNTPNTPAWHVWARPCDTAVTLGSTGQVASAYQDLGYTPANGGQISIPAGDAGLYDIKVTPELTGWQRGTVSEFWVHDIVEIRAPAALGAISVYTANDRLHFNPGEQIPFTVSVRCLPASLPSSVTVNLTDSSNTVVAGGTAPITAGQTTASLFIPGVLSAGLRPGSYTLQAANGAFTCTPQPLILGVGMQKPPFRFVLYGDYGNNYINGPLSQERDLVANHAVALKKLGINMVVDRLGWNPAGNLSWANSLDGAQTITAMTALLSADATATDPAKANPDSPLQQTVAAYSAGNTESMSILMYNDAGMPAGTGFDGRTQTQFQNDITTLTNGLLPYPAFRGWSWASNWWNFGGGDGTTNAPDETTYQAAVATAKSTGVWDPFIDTIANTRLQRAPDTWTMFAATPVIQAHPQLVQAAAAPFRNIDGYPPFTFSTVQEADGQAQWEQYMMPWHTIWNIDYHKRPGKKAWTHPEIWNDTGTGEQILQSSFMSLLRQADGVGCSSAAGGENLFEAWGPSALPEDARGGMNGITSVYRAMNAGILQPYGPWLSTLNKNDRVAIVVSDRQTKIDDWPNDMPRYYGRLYEAYMTLMYCHYPPALIFTNDLTAGSLTGYKAVFLVDQWVQLDPGLHLALTNAHSAGAMIFYDGDCKDVDNLFPTFNAAPLGISFNSFESMPRTSGNDYNFLSMLAVIQKNEAAVTAALAAIPPPASIGIDEILTAESTEEQGRYIFVLNNITPAIDTANMWKVTNFCASRVPIQTSVTLPNVTGMTVYDVFAQTSLGTPNGGKVTADLRSLPLRLFALLPKAIHHIALSGPNTAVTGGQPFTWTVQVCDASGAAIAASIPLHVQLLAADGVTVLRELYTAATAAGATGAFVLPVNPAGGAPMLKATELFTGLTAVQTVTFSAAAPGTLPLQGQPGPTPGTPIPTGKLTTSSTPDAAVLPAQNAFGPHVRDMVISADGAQALCTTMNWDHNLYAVNLTTGAVAWRQRAGMYFSFAPQSLNAGFAVQGFNFGTAEGYGFYLVNSAGALTRRFDSYGIASRMTGWLLTTPVESDPSNNFTAAPDGSWVATAGNLGLAVWNSNGTLLWKQNWPDRHVGRVAALTPAALLVCEGMTITCYAASNGKQNWQLTLSADAGIISKVAVSGDGSKCALLATVKGGRVFVLNSGTGGLAATIPSGGQDLAISTTGAFVALANANQLKLYSVSNGLQWIFGADSYVRFPRFSPDNTKIACCSDLGTVNVLDAKGAVLLERDLGALCAVAWHPGGDLILASWEGTVTRLHAGSYAPLWSTLLTPTATDIRANLTTGDGAPVTHITTWSNAQSTPYPLTPNLLSPTTSYVSCVNDHTQYVTFQPTNLSNATAYTTNDATPLVDGSATPPSTPWLLPTDVFYQPPYGANHLHLQLDTWNRMMQLTGITLYEDPAHPESWLRDATLDYWDVPSQSWKTAQTLLSDAAVHSHAINPPLQTPRVRISMPANSTTNTRLGEIVLNGALLGCSHPDVVAGHNSCVLLDENTFQLSSLSGGVYKFQYSDAYAGGMCLAKTDTNLVYIPWYQSPFAYLTQDWKMKITQTPQNADEYRYLQFAWKAVDPNVTGITLEVGSVYGGLNGMASIYCGNWCGLTMWPFSATSTNKYQASTTVPTGWTVVNVDLWQFLPTMSAVDFIDFGSIGGTGNVEFDAVKLLKTDPTGQNYTPPSVDSFTTDSLVYTAPASVVMSALASDANAGGAVTKVEFYNGAALIGTATSTPFTATWTNIMTGHYALTARAYNKQGLQTNSSLINITVNTPVCAVPVLVPPPGAYFGPVTVTLTCATPGAVIHYTTDGSTPTAASPAVTAPIFLTSSTVLNAMATATGMIDSAGAGGAYTITLLPCATPALAPPPGTYIGQVAVALSCATTGAVIHYTTDGSTPTAASPVASAPLTFTTTTTLKAIATASYTLDSPLAAGQYKISPQVAAPVVTPADGSYPLSVTVSCTCATPGAVLHYTTDGSDPSAASPSYSRPLLFTHSVNFAVKGLKAGVADSAVTHRAYTVLTQQVATPVFAPGSGQTAGPVQIRITCATAGAELHYTLDNSTPTRSSPLYIAPFTLTGNSIVQAFAVKAGWADSAVAIAKYTVIGDAYEPDNSYTQAKPISNGMAQQHSLNPVGDTDWVKFTLTQQSDVYVTADAPVPLALALYAATNLSHALASGNNSLSRLGLSPGLYYIQVVGTTNQVVLAYQLLLQTASPNQVVTPFLSPQPGAFTSPQTVTLRCPVPGAVIRFTTDGTDPTNYDPAYTQPLLLKQTTTIKARAFKTGYLQNNMAVGIYTINGGGAK